MHSFNCYFCKSNMKALYNIIKCSNCQGYNSQFFIDSKISSIILFNNKYSIKLDFIKNQSSIYRATNYGVKKIYQVNSIINITPQNIKKITNVIITNMKKCYFCKKNTIYKSCYRNFCDICNALHYYNNESLDCIELSCNPYYILINFIDKICYLNKDPFNHICYLNFDACININPQNIESKINTILAFL